MRPKKPPGQSVHPVRFDNGARGMVNETSNSSPIKSVVNLWVGLGIGSQAASSTGWGWSSLGSLLVPEARQSAKNLTGTKNKIIN